MPEDIEKANELSAKKSEFSNWYSQALQVAEIIDKRYNVKGMNVWMPYGYSIMMAIKKFWDDLFQKDGIKEMYFPLIVPLEYCEQNESWWEGFKNEAFWVKGLEEKKATHILRSTGEPAMYPMFSIWIRSSNNLPFRIYETVSSFRYETSHTRPLIRDREITVWHEIHTAHESKEDAEDEAKKHEGFYDEIWEFLALPSIKVRKPQWEVFPGAVGAIEYYSLMPTGRVMENGSINNLGQAYAKKFNIKFKNEKGKEDFVWQICTGNGARLLAGVIAVHGDDRGLVLPPNIAPIQAVIVPIYSKKDMDKVIKECENVKKELEKECVRVHLDLRKEFPGSKFYDWEIKGVPLRIEIGSRDISQKQVTVVRRDTLSKEAILNNELKKIRTLLDQIQNDLLKKAQENLDKHTKTAAMKTELEKKIKGNLVKVGWCGSGDCWDNIKEIAEGVELFGADLKQKKGTCIICGKVSNEVGYVARTY